MISCFHFFLQETSTTSRTTSLDILLTDDGYYDSSTESEFRPERRAEPRVDFDADTSDVSYDDIDIFGDEGHIDITGAEFGDENRDDQEEDLLT